MTRPMHLRISELLAETDDELIARAQAAVCVLSGRLRDRQGVGKPVPQAFYASNRAATELRMIEEELNAIAAAELSAARRAADRRRRRSGEERPTPCARHAAQGTMTTDDNPAGVTCTTCGHRVLLAAGAAR